MSGVKRAQKGAGGARKRAKISDEEESSEAEVMEVSSDEEEEEDEEDGDDDDDEEDAQDDDDEVTADDGISTLDRMQHEQRILATSRELGADMKNARAKAAREGGLEQAKKYLKRVNENFSDQQTYRLDNKTLEMYDSKNLYESSDLMDIATRNIKIGNTRRGLKPEEFTKRMRELLLKRARDTDPDGVENPEEFNDKKHPFGMYNWFYFGTFAYSRGKKATTTDHLLGPLEIEKKVRQFKPRERLETTKVVTTAEAVTSEDVDRNAKDHTTTAVQNCYTQFARKNPQGGAINIFKFFINPYSFGQSVENMFYTSFLLRDGRLLLSEDEDGFPTISYPPPLPTDPFDKQKEMARRQQLSSNHIIFHLEYDSWKTLIKRFKITESYLPHRDETPA